MIIIIVNTESYITNSKRDNSIGYRFSGEVEMQSKKRAPLLEFASVSAQRGTTTALNDITLSVNLGENAAIIGPNGSGKSTLIKLITRECYPVQNSAASFIKILGETVWDVSRLRSMLGIVSPDLQEICNRRISGRDMVVSGFFSSIGLFPYQYVTEDMLSRADSILGFLNISHLADRSMTDMSAGQARAMLIARALVHDPQALILDEPTSSLDPSATRKFLKSLSELAKAGKSIIMVTHHIHDIIPEIDRIIMIKNGRVFADGSKKELIKENVLSELFSMAVEIQKKDGFCYLLR